MHRPASDFPDETTPSSEQTSWNANQDKSKASGSQKLTYFKCKEAGYLASTCPTQRTIAAVDDEKNDQEERNDENQLIKTRTW